MKSIYYIPLLFIFLAFALDSFSQEQDQPQRRTRQRGSEATTGNAPELTERARIKNEEASKKPSHVVWLREIYRDIDLEKESNAALYFPIQPIGDRVNLFTLIFRLMSENKVAAYNYLDGREIFTDEEKVNFEDVLKRYQILYTTQGTGTNLKYIIDDSDIPSAEVLIYMIKEGWYFDEATGTFKSQIIALCPMLVREDYYAGGTTKDAMFWIPYENIRPYLSREMLMTSNYNNALTYTIDDYFTKQMYSGTIIKTVNLMNQSLAQQVGNDSIALKNAQDSIENQLTAFAKNLWIQKDTTSVDEEGKDVKAKKENTKTSGRGTKKEEKAEKPKASKAEKSSSTPTKSVRRR